MTINSRINRWLDKANSHDSNEIFDVFDKFITLFICYNITYNYLNDAINLGFSSDSDKAIQLPLKLDLATQLFSDDEIQTRIIAASDFIQDETYEFRKTEDERIRHDIQSNNPETWSKAMLSIIYYTRCNLFHGDKELDMHQESLISNLNPILRRIVEIMLELIPLDE